MLNILKRLVQQTLLNIFKNMENAELSDSKIIGLATQDSLPEADLLKLLKTLQSEALVKISKKD